MKEIIDYDTVTFYDENPIMEQVELRTRPIIEQGNVYFFSTPTIGCSLYDEKLENESK